MNKKIISKTLTILLFAGITIQAGFTAYSMIDTQSNNTVESQVLQETTISTELQEEDTANTDISEEIQNLIRQSDPANFDKNIANYKNLLIDFNVHSQFKEEIERLIREGHKLPDILSGYEFLYHNYGTVQELENFITQKESGKTWKQIFGEYNKNNAEFIPRSFDTDYLEGLMKTPSITSDDIMIADRISYESGQAFEELINKKMEDKSWKTLNAEVGIINSASILPRVEVTSEQLKKYLASGALTEQQIVEAFVLAQKLGKSTDVIIGKVKAGYTEESIIQEYCTEKYY
ncbi:MAG: hypothetical protein ACOYVK_16185 [Bacillota bacterium]